MADYSVITRLRLKEIFDGETVFSSVTNDEDYLNTLFEHSIRTHLFVFDSAEKGVSTYVTDTKGLGRDKLFIADNPKRLDSFLLHIDGVLYKTHSKCDCALITKNEICFIEFKSNAINENDLSAIANYEKASSQLQITVQDFLIRFSTKKMEIYSLVNVKAFAVFNKTVPQDLAYQKKVSAKFLKATRVVKLAFQNSTVLE